MLFCASLIQQLKIEKCKKKKSSLGPVSENLTTLFILQEQLYIHPICTLVLFFNGT
jgi:hypothetical protein